MNPEPEVALAIIEAQRRASLGQIADEAELKKLLWWWPGWPERSVQSQRDLDQSQSLALSVAPVAEIRMRGGRTVPPEVARLDPPDRKPMGKATALQQVRTLTSSSSQKLERRKSS
jgi:hypothetical protein